MHFLNEVAKSYNKENIVIKIDVTDIYKEEFAGCPNEGAYCSPYTLLRLFADKIPEIPDKAFYLDADILFNREPELLYDIDVKGYEYAAARDHYGKYLINPNYINAGVLLLIWQRLRKQAFLKKQDISLRQKNYCLRIRMQYTEVPRQRKCCRRNIMTRSSYIRVQ